MYGKLQRLKASDPTTGKRRRREEKRREGEKREEERKEKREEKRREERRKEEIVWKDAAAEGTRPQASWSEPARTNNVSPGCDLKRRAGHFSGFRHLPRARMKIRR